MYVHCFINKRIEQNCTSFPKPLLFTIALGANIYSLIDLHEDLATSLLILGSKMFPNVIALFELSNSV